MSNIILTGDTSGTLNLAAPLVAGTNTQTLVAATGTLAPLISGTAVASTSGTSIDFTGIPSWVKRITVMFNGVSTSGTSVTIIQLGTSSGIEASGYTSGTGVIQLSTASQSTLVTSGISTGVSGYVGAGTTLTGAIAFSLIGSNAWVASGNTMREAGGTTVFFTSGSKTLAATLDRVRITAVNGTDTFDAGSINILYE